MSAGARNQPSTYGIDVTRPNVARVHDALLGGRDNYAADRQMAETLTKIYPGLRDMAREDRGFLIRAVTWAARQGIRQYADIGTGMPRWPGVGDTARNVIPAAKVVYVDADPVVVAHVKVLLAEDADATVDADLADPATVTGHPAFRGVIDLAAPVCLVFGLVLNLFPARKAREIVSGYARLAAPGSVFVVSCGRVDDAALWDKLSGAYTPAPVCNHSPGEVAGFLAGLELVPPGLVAAQNWRGGWHDAPVTPPGPAYVLGAVARKP
jgi:hypothetical protein